MKLLLRPLLILAVLLAIFYASSPLWLPVILAKQLPPGWQLETLKISWPGVSGVNLKLVEANGNIAGLRITVKAENSRLSYRGLATTVDSAALHIYLPSSQHKPPVPLSMDDLSLPMFHLSASLPSVTVNQAQLALHLASDNPDTGADQPAVDQTAPNQPIVIALQGFQLDPANQGNYQLNSIASIVGQRAINGQISVDVSPEKLSAQLRFPADRTLPAWLDLAFTQVNDPSSEESQLQLNFDADATGGKWLDGLLSRSTNGRLAHVGGQLQARAFFGGDQSRIFTTASVNASNFQADLAGTTAMISTHIEAKREAQVILLEFVDTGSSGQGSSGQGSSGQGSSGRGSSGQGDSDNGDAGAGRISLLDRNAQIEATIAKLIPELTRSSKASSELQSNSKAAAVELANAALTIAQGSQLTLNLPDNALAQASLSFSGGLALDYSNHNSSFQLNLGELIIGIADLENMGQYDMAGGLALNWQEQGPFSYTNETLSLAAKSLMLKATGKLAVAPDKFNFQPTGRVDAQLPGLEAKLLTGEASSPGWIAFTADDLKTTQARLGINLTGLDLNGPADDTQSTYTFKGPLHATNPKITVFSPDEPVETVVTASELSITGTLTSEVSTLISSGIGYLSTAHVMPMAANASRLDLKWTELDLSSLTGALEAKTEGFKIKVDEETYTGFNLNTTLKLLNDDAINGSGEVIFDNHISLPIEYSGNTRSSWWDVNLLSTTLPLAGLRGLLRSAHIVIPAELKLADGSINVGGLIQVHDDISAQLNLSGSDIAADLAASSVQQASFRFNAGYLQDIFATGPIAIQAVELAGGIHITDISTELELQNSQNFGLSNLTASLLDGQLKIDQLNFADSSIEDTTINLTNINLQKMLAFLDMDGLSGDGFIDLSLPAGRQGGIIHIRDGTFTSTGPGRLAYSKGDLASTNIGLQAMDNFHYKSLSGKVAYDSTGPYQITIRLEGNNPDLYSGYPVIFNLTINGSLPALFEAMFITGSFEDSILQQIKMK